MSRTVFRSTAMRPDGLCVVCQERPAVRPVPSRRQDPAYPKLCDATVCAKKYVDGYDAFLRATKTRWPHDLRWLASKLGLQPDDGRLPEIALRLAERGELVVYIRADGIVGEVARPKHPRGAAAA